MKKTLLAAALVALASLSTGQSAQAQGGGGMGRGMGGQRMMEMMLKDITLSDAQKAKVDSIQAEFQKSMPQMTPGEPPAPEMREKMMAARQKQQADIRAILTDEQKVVFDKNIANMPMGRRPGA